MKRLFLYHKNKEPKIINQDELSKYENSDWYSSPLDVPGIIKTMGVDTENPAMIQAAGEELSGYAERFNGLLNLELMKKRELIEFSQFHYKKELKSWRNKQQLIFQINKLAGM